jgi:hypothetical protein
LDIDLPKAATSKAAICRTDPGTASGTFGKVDLIGIA